MALCKVPFYDADRYDWKEAAAWKVELPAAYRWGLGPVRYRRSAHEEAKEQLRAALRSALQDSRALHLLEVCPTNCNATVIQTQSISIMRN